MPLGDDQAFDEWCARGEGVHPAVARVVRDWIEAAGRQSWTAPSIPIQEMSNQPVYEIREAVVPDSGGVLVIYTVTYVLDVVDLVWVGDNF